jgi:hypothetical protein
VLLEDPEAKAAALKEAEDEPQEASA